MRSLRGRVAVVVVLTFIPAFVAIYLDYRDDRSDARETSAEETRALATNVAAQYEDLIGDTRTLLRAIGSVPPTDIILGQCQGAFAAMTRQTPTYDNLFVLGGDGSVICSARPIEPPIDPGAEWIRIALSEGEFVGLDPEAGSDTGGTYRIALGLDEGHRPFVVAAEIRLDGLGPLIGDVESSSEESVTVVDGSDVILYQKPGEELVGDDGAELELISTLREAPEGTDVMADGPDGVERIYTGEVVEDPPGSFVVAGISTEATFAAPEQQLRSRLLWLTLLAVLVLALALLFAHLSVIRRIRDLVTMTRRIGDGELEARSQIDTRDEIGELARSLDAMADHLQLREEERAHLLTAIVEASEEERKRIAGDVHDDSIQVMSAHVMNLQLMRRRVDDPQTQQRIRDLEESGRAATARLRDLVFELHSPTLEERGLRAALDTLLERSFEDTDVSYTVTSALETEPSLPTGATAYRIAQEVIRNCRQHAAAETIAVDLARSGSQLLMTITDDGRGFDPDALGDRPGHLGLRGMSERATAVGGTVVVDARPGQGTTVACRLPWLLDVEE